MKRLDVFLSLDIDEEIKVGQLAKHGHRIYFQYDEDFLAKSIWLSPYKLPLEAGLLEHKDTGFSPVFGLFDDSLPDGWGLMLMDRFLRQKGYNVEELSVLDRLSLLGSNAMGALTYKPTLEVDSTDKNEFDLQDLYVQSQELISGKSTKVLAALMNAGGSPGGARPKVLVGLKNDIMVSGEGGLPEGFEHWMIKFKGYQDFDDSGSVEYAYSMMAKDCDLHMPETRLFTSEKGERFFGVKRFDREKEKRFHMHTFGNMIHSNFRIPACDYEQFFKITLNLTKNHQDLLRGFRQMVFNVFMNNRDDHVKNFAFIMNHEGEWALSPAYDLTFSTGPGGEHSMTIDGEGRTPTTTHIFNLGKKMGIKKGDISTIVDQVQETRREWPRYAEISGTTETTMERIKSYFSKT